MKILVKVFDVLAVLSMVSIGVGFIVAIWFNVLTGLKVVLTSFISMAICMVVALSIDIYQ